MVQRAEFSKLGRHNPSSRFGGGRRSSFILLGKDFGFPGATSNRAGGMKPRQATLDEYNLLILTKTKYKTEANSPFSPLAGISAVVACGLRARAAPAGGGARPGMVLWLVGAARGWLVGCLVGAARGSAGGGCAAAGGGDGAGGGMLLNKYQWAGGSGDGGPGWGGLRAAGMCLADDLPGPAVAHARL